MGTKVILFPDTPVIVKNQVTKMCSWGAWDPYLPARLQNTLLIFKTRFKEPTARNLSGAILNKGVHSFEKFCLHVTAQKRKNSSFLGVQLCSQMFNR